MQMDEQALIQRLDSCLLSDEEMALGPQVWQSWSNPFKQDDETMLIAYKKPLFSRGLFL